MFDISILCPTKYRHNELERMWTSALNTSTNPEKIELVLYIENYDTETLQLVEKLRVEYGNAINDTTATYEVIYSDLHNICCKNCTADIFMCAADDLIFRTDEWDVRVKELFDSSEDKIMYAYPNDGHWGEELGTHGFFHKRWFDTLGYILPPIFTVDYSDNYLMDVSRSLNRSVYMEDVVVEHMHWTFGKSQFDITAQEAHVRRQSTNNAALYNSEDTQNCQKNDINKLKNIMKN